MTDQPGFDEAEFHCYRCGDVITGTDPATFGRAVADHRTTCPQTRAVLGQDGGQQ